MPAVPFRIRKLPLIGLFAAGPAAAAPWSDAPADTDGTVLNETADWPIAPAALATPQRIAFTLAVGRHGVRQGGSIRVSLGHLLPTAQRLYVPFSLGVAGGDVFAVGWLRDVEVRTARTDVRLSVTQPDPAVAVADLQRAAKQKGARVRLRDVDEAQAVVIRVDRGELREGDQIHVVLGAREGLIPPRNEASFSVIVRLDGDGDGVYGLIPDPPTIDAYSADTKRVTLVAPANLGVGERNRFVLRTEDGAPVPNLTRFERAEITLEPQNGLEYATSFVMAGDGDTWDPSVLEVPVTGRRIGVYRIRGKATVDGRSFEILSNPIEVVPAGAPRVYFGDLHLHSVLSADADPAPERVYWRRQVADRLDFMALTDHDLAYSLPPLARDAAVGLAPDEWAYLKRLADEYTIDGAFVAFKAYEWTSDGYGHRNVVYSGRVADPKLWPHNVAAGGDPADQEAPAALQAHVAGAEALVIPHGTALATRGGAYGWGHPAQVRNQRAVELYSALGSSELAGGEYDVGKTRPTRGNKAFAAAVGLDAKPAGPDGRSRVQDAWRNGWRLGVVGGADDHGHAHGGGVWRPGLTAVAAPELTRDAVWQSLWERRTYATTGERILMHFEVDGQRMGGVATRGAAPARLEGRVYGTAPIDRVEVVKGNAAGYTVVREVSAPGGYDYAFSFEDPSAAAGDFYYLRVRQQDGGRAWSSPVWLDASILAAPPPASPAPAPAEGDEAGGGGAEPTRAR